MRTQMFLHPKTMYQFKLEIADVSITLYTTYQWREQNAFLPFMKENENPDYEVVFRMTELLPEIPDSEIYQVECYRVHSDKRGGYLRSFFDAPRDFTPYAVAEYDYDNGKIWIDYLAKGERCVSEIHNSFFHIGFEAMLIHKKRLCFHAACIDTQLGGILFSGPSGIGKSTQADLWCKYRNAELINGDRPILSKDKKGWLAWGSPYAGSSKCHVNKNCSVTAIVMLQQTDQCTVRQLHGVEAFRAVWSGMTVYSWDKWFVEEAIELTMKLIEEVPVFEFCCTPDKEAVEYLEQELRKRCCL